MKADKLIDAKEEECKNSESQEDLIERYNPALEKENVRKVMQCFIDMYQTVQKVAKVHKEGHKHALYYTPV